MGKWIIRKSGLDAARGEKGELVGAGGDMAMARRGSEVTSLIIGNGILIATNGLQALDGNREGVVGGV